MGVRKLITTYTSDGASHTLGERAGDRLLRLLDVRAKIQSILKKKALGRKAKRVLEKSDERYARKLVHLRDELHRKLTSGTSLREVEVRRRLTSTPFWGAPRLADIQLFYDRLAEAKRQTAHQQRRHSLQEDQANPVGVGNLQIL